MARRSQCSSAGDNPLNPNYLPPHYREEYRLAIDALVEEDLEAYYQFLQKADVVDFLSSPEIQYILDSVQAPQLTNQPEQRFFEAGGDGSSDTYWPIHSDLDAPGLDLGWPQLHHFIGPTEVTTLVNPPEPDMPSIKEQARRLIKNAHQVIAIVMDMFTDVDIFHDILNAAMRNVAVYILLDEQNVHHFINMAFNCRVNLESIQFLRVRTVAGITYHCRSGKAFKGQMMDRFLLTDCRAVLSGNYSFMWSFEKLHRCMAHLFLGQLVATFDEEFRILFAQSQPLVIENVLPPMEDYSLLQKRQYPSERTSLYRQPKKFLSQDTAHPDEWVRHAHDEKADIDWRLMPLKMKEPVHSPADIYSRFPSQQSRMDPSFEKGPSRMPMMENPAFKRHSYAEGVQGRYSFPFLPQQGTPEPENQGRPFHRGQQPYPGAGKEADYSAHDKFWNQDYLLADQYSEPGLPQEMEPPDNFDPVLNYLSSTRNVDFDQGSEKLPPAADLPFSSSHPRRLSLGQSYACQKSPSLSNSTEQKQFFQEPAADRKDPMVKRGLRDWRISSYLSAYESPGDEGLPLAPPNVPDPFEEPSNLIQQTAPAMDLSVPKIPNVREFKVPAMPRASQMPSYAKTMAREQPKKLLDEATTVTAETRATPSPSGSSSTNEGEKMEEAEQQEPKTAPPPHREETFRRKYNAAKPRSSRLRSSLIFSSLEQQHTSQDTTSVPDQQDEESGKNEPEQTKESFVSQVLGKRRTTARGPLEWSRYIKSATFDSSATDLEDGNSKTDDKDSSKAENSKDDSEKPKVQESLKPPDAELVKSSPSVPPSKPYDAELPKTDQPKQPPTSLLSNPLYVDMNDPDMRLKFFKELAAKRKAAKAAEAEKSKEKVPIKSPTELKNTLVKEEERSSQETSKKIADSPISESISQKNATEEDASGKTNKEDSQVRNDPNITQSCSNQTIVSTDSEKKELKNSQPAANVPVSTEPEAPPSKPPEDSKASNLAVEKSSTGHPPTPTKATPANNAFLTQGTSEIENPSLDSTSNESSSLISSSVEVPPSSASAALDSISKNPESVPSETSISSPPLLSEKHTGLELSSHKQSGRSSSSDPILPDSGPQTTPSSSFSSSTPLSTPAGTISLNVSTKDSTLPSSTLSPSTQETVSPSAQSVEDTSSKLTASSISQTEPEPTQAHLDSVSHVTSSKTPSAVDSVHVESDIFPDTHASGSEPNTSSLQSTTKTESEESCAPTPLEKDIPESENSSIPQVVGKDSEFHGSSTNVETVCTAPSLSPSLPESCLPNESDLESKSRFGQSEIKSTPTPADPPSDHSPGEIISPVRPDLTPKASLSETTASSHDSPKQVTPPCELNLTGPVDPSPAEAVSCSSPLAKSVLSPEAEKTLSALHSPSDTDSVLEQVSTDSNKTCSLAESTSKVPSNPCKTPESVTPGVHSPEPLLPAESSNMDSQNEVSQEPETPKPKEENPDHTEAKNKVSTTTSQESACSEKTNDQVRQNNLSDPAELTSDKGVPTSPQSKQPKTSQSRYHSSTANVLSSSNLRDDTKLLLGQISANNQNRNEGTKESPVTDDEKEDEADKNAKTGKEKGMRSLSRGQPKSDQEREKLLERIQSMRKERKVYSRFEMGP